MDASTESRIDSPYFVCTVMANLYRFLVLQIQKSALGLKNKYPRIRDDSVFGKVMS
jgi:hypothetical protein